MEYTRIGQQQIEDVKTILVCNNLTDIDLGFQIHGFLHFMRKGEVCITSHNTLRISMVYCRMMIAAFILSLQ